MKKLIAPFIRIIFLIVYIIGVALFIVEQITFTIAIPLIWILSGKGVDEICDMSFIEWLEKNKIAPFFEKIGDKVI